MRGEPGGGLATHVAAAHTADGSLLFGTLDEGDEWAPLPQDPTSKTGNPSDVFRDPRLQRAGTLGRPENASVPPVASPFATLLAHDASQAADLAKAADKATHMLGSAVLQTPVRSSGSGLAGSHLDRTESSGSVMGGVMSAVSWIGAVGRAASLVLPRVLRRVLNVDEGGSEVDGGSAAGSDHDEASDQDQVLPFPLPFSPVPLFSPFLCLHPCSFFHFPSLFILPPFFILPSFSIFPSLFILPSLPSSLLFHPHSFQSSFHFHPPPSSFPPF